MFPSCHWDTIQLQERSIADLTGVACAANAEALFGSQEAALFMPHRGGPLTPYWASLAGSLTRLELVFGQSVGGATISPLNQLTRLESLSLRCCHLYAGVELSLPQLQKLNISHVRHARITLQCPQLKALQVQNPFPLESIDGVPTGLEDLTLFSTSDCSKSLYSIFQGRRLEQLRTLLVFMSPQAYDSPVASEVIKQVLREGKLTILGTDCPLEQLTPLTGPQCALPTSLEILELHLPLEKGIPVVLEQLTNLVGLTLENTSKGPMHLTRSLDPFLDMKDLGCLAFMGKPAKTEHALQTRFEWTSEALEFLLLARIRLQKEADVSGSRRPPTLWC